MNKTISTKKLIKILNEYILECKYNQKVCASHSLIVSRNEKAIEVLEELEREIKEGNKIRIPIWRLKNVS